MVGVVLLVVLSPTRPLSLLLAKAPVVAGATAVSMVTVLPMAVAVLPALSVAVTTGA
jgi:hypothetical protein